jgi:hypothetical protein
MLGKKRTREKKETPWKKAQDLFMGDSQKRREGEVQRKNRKRSEKGARPPSFYAEEEDFFLAESSSSIHSLVFPRFTKRRRREFFLRHSTRHEAAGCAQGNQ